MEQLLNRDLVAVRHLLDAPTIASRTAPFVHDRDFDWEGIHRAAGTMSGGEQLLVRIAGDLWLATREVAVWEVPRRLDPMLFSRVVTALRACQGFPPSLPNAAALDLAA